MTEVRAKTAEGMLSRSQRLVGTAALVGACFLWSVGLAATKALLDEFAALHIVFVRLSTAVPIVLFLAWRRRELRLPLRLAVLLGVTGYVGNYLFMTLGVARVSVAAASIVLGCLPVVTALFAVVFLRERPGWGGMLGVPLAVLGAVVAAAGDPSGSILGVVYLALANVSWSAYIVLLLRVGGGRSLLAVSALPLVVSAVLLAPTALVQPWGSAGPLSWALVVLLGPLGVSAPYLLWNFGAVRVSAVQAGVYANTLVVFSILISLVILRETVTPRAGLGAALVILGAVLASAGSRR